MKKTIFGYKTGWVVTAGCLVCFSRRCSQAASQTPWKDKVESDVLAQGKPWETEFVIFLNEQADLSGTAR